jgi:dihydrodipicolinate synthase/N-acetylneuraminate lyase
LKAHYRAIDKEVGIPIYIYNIPGRSVIDMTPETMAELFETCKNIKGVKDATANMSQARAGSAICAVRTSSSFRVRTSRRSASTPMAARAASR